MSNPLHHQLRRFRLMQALSQQELADRAGITRVALNRIERGISNAQESTLEALAHGVGSEILVIPRAHVSEVLRLIGLTPAVADPGAGSTFEDVFLPDPDEEADHG